MESVLLTIYKNRLNVILNLYMKSLIDATNLIDKKLLSYARLIDIYPTKSEIEKYHIIRPDGFITETQKELQKKVQLYFLLNSFRYYDKSIGELIEECINLENEISKNAVETKKKNEEEFVTNYLFFDTETTGLPKNYKSPYTDTDNWPRLVQLAYILCDSNGQVIDNGCWIVKPNNFIIPNEASDIHRITNERAQLEGLPINIVLNNFKSILNQSDYLIAHNISFDVNILGAELTRSNIKSNIDSIIKVCTMENSTNYCAIKGNYGYKWPKLSELYFNLFNANFEEAHDAAVDIEATYKCFWELINKKIINL